MNKATFAKKGRSLNEMSTQQIKFIVDKISSSGVSKIRITGGEPLLRKDIFEIIKYAKTKKLFVILNTNGFLVDKRNSILIRKYVDRILISLNSYSDIKLSRMTGVKNALKKKIKSIKLLKGCNEIWLCSVATHDNIVNIEKLHKIVKRLKPDYWFILRQIPTQENTNPTKNEDVKFLVEKLFFIKRKFGILYTLGNSLPFCSYEPAKVSMIVDDGAQHVEGCSKLVIDPSGKVEIDYSIAHPVGNIFKDDILDCWNNDFAKNFRELNNVPLICKKCKYLKRCRGGSRYCARITTKKYSGLDPLARPKTFLKRT
jgi:radical SAM protein with 4Fe4S-binding SPASM domain